MKSLQPPHRIKRLLCLILSANMALWGVPLSSFAQQPTINSIVVEAYDPVSGRLLPSLGGLKVGDKVNLKVKAFDRFGNSVPCTPKVEAIQGFTGNQIEGFGPPDAENRVPMTVGKGFGSAEIKASCQENPSVSAKEFVGVSTTLTAPKPSLLNPPPSPTPAPAPEAAAGAGGGHGGIIAAAVVLGVLAVAGLAYLAIPKSKQQCASGSHACNPGNSNSPCCPDGRTVYCTGSGLCTNQNGSGTECGSGGPRQSC